MALAVFDVGKTNKKFAVFSEDLRPVASESVAIGERVVSGLLCDDVEAVERWVLSRLREGRERYGVRAVAVTTFGATLALLDREGRLVMPVVSYNHEVGPEVRRGFYEEFGSPEGLYARTGTPPLGQLLNAGLQLYWLSREYPERYSRAELILFLPQLLSYRLSRGLATEITSVGCHTYLYDLTRSDWSDVAVGLGVPERAPGFMDAWGRLGCCDGVAVAVGIHDSNASLLPYLVAERGDFVLASTGTWCVFMWPGGAFSPSADDVYKDVLYYIDAFGRPVRASRFKCGFEFDHYVRLIRERFGTDPLAVEFDERVAVELLRGRGAFVVPTLAPGTGQFPRSKGRVVDRGFFRRGVREAYHALNLSIAVQTYYALKALTGGVSGLRLVVQGGFAKNDVYLRLLATIAPGLEVLRSKYPEATSLGAAMLAKCALEGCRPEDLRDCVAPLLGVERVRGVPVDDAYVSEYLREFEELCSEGV